jgi:hypothetical protein
VPRMRGAFLIAAWWISASGIGLSSAVSLTERPRLQGETSCPADGAGPKGTAVGALALPDLRTLPPSDLRLEVRSTGRVLRFANTVWNRGPAPLELRGEAAATTGLIQVYQTICNSRSVASERRVGEFVWHASHGHWHLEAFARYELWSLSPDGDIDQLVAQGEKISYCMRDTDAVDGDRPGFSDRPSYGACGPRRQGLSVGWGDKYKSFLEGQELELGDLADGIYALVSTANPGAALLEADYDNNTAVVYVRILGRTIEVVPLHELRKEVCLSQEVC